MFAQIRHIGIRSQDPKTPGKFYEALFGMRVGANMNPKGASVNFGDGYVGVNINPRVPGSFAGLEHFGLTVESVDVVDARLRESYPSIRLLKRPGNRPFAGISTHDPAGNVFDLSWTEMERRGGVYVDEFREQERRVQHIALRAVDPETVARFHNKVFELEEQEKAGDDPNFYVSDGRVTLIVRPWRILEYEDSEYLLPGMDHLGFKVESIDAVVSDLEELVERDATLSPKPWKGFGGNREALLREFAKCRYGQHQLWDPDGVLIDLVES